MSERRARKRRADVLEEPQAPTNPPQVQEDMPLCYDNWYSVIKMAWDEASKEFGALLVKNDPVPETPWMLAVLKLARTHRTACYELTKLLREFCERQVFPNSVKMGWEKFRKYQRMITSLPSLFFLYDEMGVWIFFVATMLQHNYNSTPFPWPRQNSRHIRIPPEHLPWRCMVLADFISSCGAVPLVDFFNATVPSICSLHVSSSFTYFLFQIMVTLITADISVKMTRLRLEQGEGWAERESLEMVSGTICHCCRRPGVLPDREEYILFMDACHRLFPNDVSGWELLWFLHRPLANIRGLLGKPVLRRAEYPRCYLDGPFCSISCTAKAEYPDIPTNLYVIWNMEKGVPRIRVYDRPLDCLGDFISGEIPRLLST